MKIGETVFPVQSDLGLKQGYPYHIVESLNDGLDYIIAQGDAKYGPVPAHMLATRKTWEAILKMPEGWLGDKIWKSFRYQVYVVEHNVMRRLDGDFDIIQAGIYAKALAENPDNTYESVIVKREETPRFKFQGPLGFVWNIDHWTQVDA